MKQVVNHFLFLVSMMKQYGNADGGPTVVGSPENERLYQHYRDAALNFYREYLLHTEYEHLSNKI